MLPINFADSEYCTMLEVLFNHGDDHLDRTGVGTKRYFGWMSRFNLATECTMITCKRASFKNTVAELLWFLSGSVNVNDLADIRKQADPWWRPFANEDGELGPMYGRQLRNYNGQAVDQVARVITKIKEERDSRRILMTTYNPVEADLGALYPCHGLLTQFMIDSDDCLHMSTVQRSADIGLGLPHNWISYALLQIMIAKVCNLELGELVYQVNDLHVYTDHIEPLKAMKHQSHSHPSYVVATHRSIDDYTMDDFHLLDYKAGPLIKLKMAV